MIHDFDERFYQRLEEMVEELRDISTAFNPTYGGNNMREEVKRIADNVSTATFELSRIADALVEIKKALIE